MLAFSFFPRKLTAWFRMNTSHQKYICEPLPSSRACTQSHFAVLCQKRFMLLELFPRVLSLVWVSKGSVLPRSPQRERIAVDTELWCTLHACPENLWAIQSLDVQVWRIRMSSLAQFANGMRALNCGKNSRFRIHLARMWVKTNRTKTESMDINTMLVYFDIRTSTWPTTTPISLRVSHISLAPGGAFLFPARWGLDPCEFENSNLAPFWVAKVGHMQGRWVRRTLGKAYEINGQVRLPQQK